MGDADGSPSWLQVDFSQEIFVTGLRIESTSSGNGASPRDFELQGSDDGIMWTAITGSEQTDIDDSQLSSGFEYDF
jgi:hypothetical protein